LIAQVFRFLLRLTDELSLNVFRETTIVLFCSIFTSLKDTKSLQIAFNTLTTAIENSPTSFKNLWSRVTSILAQRKWIPDIKVFSKLLPLGQFTELFHSLMSIDNFTLEVQKWCLDFLVSHFIINHFRFGNIWSSVEGYFLLLIDNQETEEIASVIFLHIVHLGFS
jgi:hypothetical protein